jgi:hypothetical protein
MKEIVLAGDADRERTIALLRDATVEGRLTLDEFAGRVGGAELARTHGELEALTADLPAETTLRVRNYFGTVTLLVPRGIHVEVDGGGPFGTREIDLPHAGPVANAPRLRVHASGPGGTLRIHASS